MRRSVLPVILVCLALYVGLAQPRQALLDPVFQSVLAENLSGELAKEHVIAITRFHRVQGSRSYRGSAQYVLAQLRSYGFGEQDAFIESYPSDGRKFYQTWQSPPGWDITSAELRMIEPEDQRIVGYPEIAMSVMSYSQPGDTVAELVWVARGTSDQDYSGKNVAGKFVLATGYGGDVHRLAVLKYGARAVVCYLDDSRAKEHPDMLQYTGLWPRPEELGKVTFGFNITNRQGERLRDLLLAGRRVVLHGRVSGTGLEPFYMDIVVAKIPGVDLPDEEVLLSAHLDHPKESANDNASGSGAILDVARTLRQLISTGRLPRPKRTIRFLWVPEWNGTMAFVDAHPAFVGPPLKGKVIANVNMDMVGENLDLLHSKMYITRPPASTPSYLGDLVENMADMVSGMSLRSPRGSESTMNYCVIPYEGGSDHMMFIDRKIPGVMIGHSDYTHHTSDDTPDKVDPVELRRSELIGAGTAWFIATARPAECADLTLLAGARAMERVGMVAREQAQQIRTLPEDTVLTVWAEAENALTHAADVERAALHSILTLSSEDQVSAAVDVESKQINLLQESTLKEFRDVASDRGAKVKIPPALEIRPDLRVPERLTRGPLDFGLPGSLLPDSLRAWYSSKEFTLAGDMRFELVNFIDGQKTVSDIRDAVSAEFSPVPVAEVAHYIEDLVRVGVVRWK